MDAVHNLRKETGICMKFKLFDLASNLGGNLHVRLTKTSCTFNKKVKLQLNGITGKL